MTDYDILVVGGGVNGCGIARDAVGRGYEVCLCEMADLASGTSSSSSKLVHGGLRYLEHYEFRLVRESLIERERLWSIAPHIISPLRFVLPHHKALRPEWFLRMGLLIYDHIGGRRELPPTRTLDLRRDPAGAPLLPRFEHAFEYSDCWVDDARLVVLNARDAADRGATIRTRTRVIAARRTADHWQVEVRDEATGAEETLTAQLLVNAAGPWVDNVLGLTVEGDQPGNVRLVQGSHIVVRRLFEHDRCYTFQEADGRIIFAIPYQDEFTLIGTTDHDYNADPGDVAITEDETDYLLGAAAEYFAEPPSRDDIVWTYAGVRPLYDDGASKAQEATRDYVLKTEGGGDQPPLINIFGGKITTYRRLAETVMADIARLIGGGGRPWTETAPLPGGDFPTNGRADLEARLAAAHPFLPEAHAKRLVRQYGTDAFGVLHDIASEDDLGTHFGADLYACEVAWLMEREWARTADDILWRRTKLGLRFTPEETRSLATWMDERISDA